MSANRKRIVFVVGSVACLAVLGFISNWVSKPASERAALKSVVELPRSYWRTPFRFSVHDGHTNLVSDRLEEIGEPFEIVSDVEYRRGPYPNVHISSAAQVAPFMQKVLFFTGYGSSGAEGGDAYVLNFFGLSFCVKKVVHVQA